MARKNIFIGEHFTVMINLDHVECATGQPHEGDPDILYVSLRSGKSLELTHGNSRMFRTAWREYHEDQ